MILLLAAAYAEIPPPDYHRELANAAADQAAVFAQAGSVAQMEAAEEFAKRWRRTLGSRDAQGSAQLAYELGLGWRLAGDAERAEGALDDAITADPTLVAALYDRGEVKLQRGDLDGALADFTEVVKHAPETWPAHFRLADIAARRGDVVVFERELTEALRYGFSFRDVAQDPAWRTIFLDPKLGLVMQRLITVYQGDDVLGLFGGPP